MSFRARLIVPLLKVAILIQLHDKRFKSYINKEEVMEIISSVASSINADYKERKPLLIGVLNGSFMFVSDLMKMLDIDCELTFVRVSSYSGTESTGTVKQVIGLEESIKEREVILLEDIIDTGNTVEEILREMENYQPKSIRVATMLFKPDVFDKKYTVDYVGKDIPNKFVVGFGLDYNGLGRNLTEIYQLEE